MSFRDFFVLWQRTDQVTDDIPIPDSPEELKLTSLSLADGTQMTNKEAIDEEQSVAGSLPDDILISIFSFLQVADRIRVERGLCHLILRL